MINIKEKIEGLRELSGELIGLLNGEKTKINVFFTVTEPLNSFCHKINNEANKCVSGFWNFGNNSVYFPHISLFMGFVDSEEQLLNVFKTVSDFSKTIAPFKIDPMALYFKSVSEKSSKYLFLDFLQNDYMYEIKNTLDELLQKDVFPIGWDIKSERTHISLGCFKHLNTKINNLVESYRQFPSCEINQIGISFMGKHGVLIGTIKTYNLEKSKTL